MTVVATTDDYAMLPGDLYNCSYSFLGDTWPTEKTDWCCTEKGRGCSTSVAVGVDDLGLPIVDVTTAVPTSSTTALRTTWMLIPVEVTSTLPSWYSTTAPFDCNAGFSNWRLGWSSEKKVWCCINRRVGCDERLMSAMSEGAATTDGAVGVATVGGADILGVPTQGIPAGTLAPTPEPPRSWLQNLWRSIVYYFYCTLGVLFAGCALGACAVPACIAWSEHKKKLHTVKKEKVNKSGGGGGLISGALGAAGTVAGYAGGPQGYIASKGLAAAAGALANSRT